MRVFFRPKTGLIFCILLRVRAWHDRENEALICERLIYPTSTGDTMSVTAKRMCTGTRYGELIITPAGVVGGLTWEGWWSFPVSHHPPHGACDSTVVIDRWLDDACAHTSDTGWDRGHQWQVTVHHTTGVVGLPREGQWRLLDLVQVQQMAERTAALAAGGPVMGAPELLPAWTWWLWTLGRVSLPVSDALGVLEYATAQEKGGLPRPRGETTLAHLI